jgi:phosphoribosylformylglycinamidine (FGAM) synthase-like enzyme
MSVTPMTSGTTTAQPKFHLPRDAGLTDGEADRIRTLLAREPNALEWGMFGAMWSEHCAYKHSKTLLRTLPTTGARVVLGPGENAGAVDLGGGLPSTRTIATSTPSPGSCGKSHDRSVDVHSWPVSARHL